MLGRRAPRATMQPFDIADIHLRTGASFAAVRSTHPPPGAVRLPIPRPLPARAPLARLVRPTALRRPHPATPASEPAARSPGVITRITQRALGGSRTVSQITGRAPPRVPDGYPGTGTSPSEGPDGYPSHPASPAAVWRRDTSPASSTAAHIAANPRMRTPLRARAHRDGVRRTPPRPYALRYSAMAHTPARRERANRRRRTVSTSRRPGGSHHRPRVPTRPLSYISVGAMASQVQATYNRDRRAATQVSAA